MKLETVVIEVTRLKGPEFDAETVLDALAAHLSDGVRFTVLGEYDAATGETAEAIYKTTAVI